MGRAVPHLHVVFQNKTTLTSHNPGICAEIAMHHN